MDPGRGRRAEKAELGKERIDEGSQRLFPPFSTRPPVPPTHRLWRGRNDGR